VVAVVDKQQNKMTILYNVLTRKCQTSISTKKTNFHTHTYTHTHTHTHMFNGPFSGTTWVSWYQKGKTNPDFTEARDSEWQSTTTTTV